MKILDLNFSLEFLQTNPQVFLFKEKGNFIDNINGFKSSGHCSSLSDIVAIFFWKYQSFHFGISRINASIRSLLFPGSPCSDPPIRIRFGSMWGWNPGPLWSYGATNYYTKIWEETWSLLCSSSRFEQLSGLVFECWRWGITGICSDIFETACESECEFLHGILFSIHKEDY